MATLAWRWRGHHIAAGTLASPYGLRGSFGKVDSTFALAVRPIFQPPIHLALPLCGLGPLAEARGGSSRISGSPESGVSERADRSISRRLRSSYSFSRPGMSYSILVTDGEQRAALAAVRSLGKAGYRVFVCSHRNRALAGGSRYVTGEAVVPDPMSASDAFVREVLRLLKLWRIDVLLPITEASLLAILGERSKIGGVRLPFVELEAFRRICDKAFVLGEAAAIGIAVPQQRIVFTRDERHSLDGENVQYPVVIKPARSVVEANGKLTSLAVRHADDWDTLQARLDDLPDAAYPVMVQKRVKGPGVGVFLLLWENERLAFFCHRRIREKPPAGGVSVYCESISPDPAIVAESERLLRRFDWRGVAMIEYKVDAQTGTPCLMEVNGRFWGSLQLAVDSGVDFPALLVRAATGERPQPVSDYRVGVRSRWFWGEVDHLLARLRRSDRELALPSGSPSRVRAIGDFFTAWRPGDRRQVLRFDDPRPFVRETIAWIRRQ